jgi:hypothetical protein
MAWRSSSSAYWAAADSPDDIIIIVIIIVRQSQPASFHGIICIGLYVTMTSIKQ